MEYLIIESDSSTELSDAVNMKIDEGYEPFGGVAVVRWKYSEDGYEFAGFQYAQALIKRK